MHSEHYQLTKETADRILETKKNGGRGHRGRHHQLPDAGKRPPPFTAASSRPKAGPDIFIYPGYEFKCIDGLITNFHLPERHTDLCWWRRWPDTTIL